MTKKVGILYYGQVRTNQGWDFALSSVREYCKRHEDVYSFDVYIHAWGPVRQDDKAISPSADFRLTVESEYDADSLKQKYAPVVSCLVEVQKQFTPIDWLHPTTVARTAQSVSLPKALSQLYSLEQVCNLVNNPEEYDSFILLRTDSVLDFWNFPLLSSRTSETLWIVQDWINVFGIEVLLLYQDLLRFLKVAPMLDEWVSAESLRYSVLKEDAIPIEGLWPVCSLIRWDEKEFACVNPATRGVSDSYLTRTYNVMHRQLPSGNLICRFPPKKSSQYYQWIGIFPQISNLFSISFKVRFIKSHPKLIARFKSHNPDKVSSNWIDPALPLGEWYHLTSHTMTAANNPFIFLILDDIVDHDEIVVEFSDISIKDE